MRGLWLSVDRGVESEAEPQSVRQRTVVELVLLVLPEANSFAGLWHLWNRPDLIRRDSPRGAKVLIARSEAHPRS